MNRCYRIFSALKTIGFTLLGILIVVAYVKGICNPIVFAMIVSGIVAIGSTWICQAIKEEHYETSYYIHP